MTGGTGLDRRLALAGLACLLAPCPGRADAAVTATRETLQMGTYARYSVVAADRAQGLALAGLAIDAVETAEQALSTFRDTSEVSAVNRAPVGEATALSPLLLSFLAPAFALAEQTGYLFDPGVGAITGAWGLHEGGRLPAPGELAQARLAAGASSFRLDLEQATVCRLQARAALDTGGFGKGAGLDLAAQALRARGVETALLDLGGQVLALGGPFEISVADPRDRERVALVIAVRDASVATSGNAERAVVVGPRRLGHIVDPRSGEPVAYDGGVTVLAPSALEADALSKPLFILGPRPGLALLGGRAGVEALFLTPVRGRLRVEGSPALLARIVATAPDVDGVGRAGAGRALPGMPR